MFKYILLCLVLSISSCREGVPIIKQEAPKNTYIYGGDVKHLTNIECGQPCILVWDPSNNSYIGKLADGRTITFVFDIDIPQE